MNAPRTITKRVTAYLSPYTMLTPEQLMTADEAAVAGDVSFFSLDPPAGYTRLCDVEVIVTVPAPDELVGNKVAALQAELRDTQADAQAKVTNLQRQIQQLLAITHEVA